MNKANQTEQKEIGRIKLSDSQDLVASTVVTRKRHFIIVDKNGQRNKESFLFCFWVSLLYHLKELTMCQLIRNCCKKTRSRTFSDMWVLGNLVSSILLWLMMPTEGRWAWFLVFLSAWRVYESLVILTHSVLFGRIQAEKENREQKLLSPERNVLYALHTYAAMLFWFAIYYIKFDHLFYYRQAGFGLDSLWRSLYFSVVTMSTLGYGDIVPMTPVGAFLVISQTLIGVFLALIILGAFISWMKPPKISGGK